VTSNNPEEPSDHEAIERARGGDHEAFKVLVVRYQGRALRLAQRVLKDDEKARDAVQEAFLKVYRSLDRFEGRSSFYTWLYRLVLNLCLDMRRRDRSDREVEWTEERAHLADPADAGQGAFLEAGDGGPAGALERAEIRERVAAAIEQLPDMQRETLILREVEGLSYQEIAEALGISKGTVMSRLHYARKKLQARLRDLM
jgi:RNA polymerase sigma-70 factor (ECF subfamily)